MDLSINDLTKLYNNSLEIDIIPNDYKYNNILSTEGFKYINEIVLGRLLTNMSYINIANKLTFVT